MTLLTILLVVFVTLAAIMNAFIDVITSVTFIVAMGIALCVVGIGWLIKRLSKKK